MQYDIDTIFREILPPTYNTRQKRRNRAVFLLTHVRRVPSIVSDEGLIFGTEEKAIERMAYSEGWTDQQQYNFRHILQLAQTQALKRRGVNGGKATAGRPRKMRRGENGKFLKKSYCTGPSDHFEVRLP